MGPAPDFLEVGVLLRRAWTYLLEPTTGADHTTPELLLTERLIFGCGFLLTAVVCALLLPAATASRYSRRSR